MACIGKRIKKEGIWRKFKGGRWNQKDEKGGIQGGRTENIKEKTENGMEEIKRRKEECTDKRNRKEIKRKKIRVWAGVWIPRVKVMPVINSWDSEHVPDRF
jgi:hypothetical protein